MFVPMIIRERNIILQSKHGRPFLADVYYLSNLTKKPVVVFSHGFKGFKDWGAFDLVADKFAEAGFVFVKFSFSHNGTTIDHPVDFVDLEAFGNDNISIELDDLGVVLDWVCSEKFVVEHRECDTEQIFLCGHSRGGGISILKAREDARVKKLCTWGSVNEIGKYWKQEEMEKIKRDGVIFIPNVRTNQMMPIKWQMYEDYFANINRLFIPDAVKQLTVPFLIIHGASDETVPVSSATEMHEWCKHSGLLIVENGNHNFGGKHPWDKSELPVHLQTVVNATTNFFSE
jgi:pimeloyl-ACP methyl ester carboxylesterase